MREAWREARRLFGALAMVSHDADGWKIGQFLKNPNAGSPPWTWEIWGEGGTVEEAINDARRGIK